MKCETEENRIQESVSQDVLIQPRPSLGDDRNESPENHTVNYPRGFSGPSSVASLCEQDDGNTKSVFEWPDQTSFLDEERSTSGASVFGNQDVTYRPSEQSPVEQPVIRTGNETSVSSNYANVAGLSLSVDGLEFSPLSDSGKMIKREKTDDIGHISGSMNQQLVAHAFNQESNIWSHLSSQNGSASMKNLLAEIVDFTCQYCNKQFMSKTLLESHVKFHLRDTLFTCEHCGKSFDSEKHLALHRKTHFVKTYICDFCGQQLSSKTLFNDHLQSHHQVSVFDESGVQPMTGMDLQEQPPMSHCKSGYKCLQCDKIFPYQSALELHIRVHTGEKPFQCKTCFKRFSQKINMLKHERLHTGMKPFSCPICGKSFNDQSNMKTHVRRFHPN